MTHRSHAPFGPVATAHNVAICAECQAHLAEYRGGEGAVQWPASAANFQ